MPIEHPKPTNSTIYKLYGSSQKCAFPTCAEQHIEIDPNTGIKMCNTVVCHIHARSENGPRWDALQSAEENRNDRNLILLCRKHHAAVDDRRNQSFYSADCLKSWKMKQESQVGQPLHDEDIVAINEANIIIAADVVSLGGEGGSAPGAGGGGGGAIGVNSQGGRGGNGGRIFVNDGIDESRELKLRPRFLTENLGSRAPGSGGGGEPAVGDLKTGGRGGDGGDVSFGQQTLAAGTFRINVGRGGRLPGEIGGSTYIELVKEDGSTELATPKVRGGLSGDSYLPDDFPEIDASDLENGVLICCLTAVEGVSIDNGAFSIERFGLSAWDMKELPYEIVFTVLTAITKRADERKGYFVSLIFDGDEKARIAVPAGENQGGYATSSYAIRIGAYFETEGQCRIVAHASGISLCETTIDIRLIPQGD